MIEEAASARRKTDFDILSILAADYTASQLKDIRKFFEQDPKAHKISDLTHLLPKDSPARKRHEALFKEWKEKYEDIANKIILHMEKGYEAGADIPKNDLNKYIQSLNEFLDELLEELEAKGMKLSFLRREGEAGYYAEIKTSAAQLFKDIFCNN